MKKRSFLIIIFVLCVFVKINAQVSFAPKVGINFAKFSGDVEDGKMSILPQVGFAVNYDINEQFALQSSLMYSAKGMKITEDDDYIKYTLHYYELPLELVTSVNLKKGKLQFFLGSYVGYCMGARLKSEISGTKWSSAINVGNTDNDSFSPIDFGYSIGVGYKFSSLQVKAGFEGSFLSIQNEYDYDGEEYDYDLKNNVLSITFAYFFDLKHSDHDEDSGYNFHY